MRLGLVLLVFAGCGVDRLASVRYSAGMTRPCFGVGAEWDYAQSKTCVTIEEAHIEFDSDAVAAGANIALSGEARRVTLRGGRVMGKRSGWALSVGVSLYDVNADDLTSTDRSALAAEGATQVSRSDIEGPGLTLKIEAFHHPAPMCRLSIFVEAHACLAEARYCFWYDDPADPSDVPGWRTETGWLDIESVTAGISVALIF